MSAKSSLITYLRAHAGLSALVGTKIRFTRAAKGDALPYVVINQVSNVPEHHMLAATDKTTGRFQLDAYGQTLASASGVAEQIRQALDGFRGSMGDVFLSTCHLESEIDGSEPPLSGEEDGIDRVQQDYLITWTVSVPSFA